MKNIMEIFAKMQIRSRKCLRFSTQFGNVKVSSLFDVGKNMEYLTGYKKDFYEDQMTIRKCRLSLGSDMKYEENGQPSNEPEILQEQHIDNEDAEIVPSKKRNFLMVHKECQVSNIELIEANHVLQPEIRK